MVKRTTRSRATDGSRHGANDPEASAFLASAIGIYNQFPELSIETLGTITRVAILRKALLESLHLSWREAQALGCPLLTPELDPDSGGTPAELLAVVAVADTDMRDDLGGLYQRLSEFSLQPLSHHRLGVASNRSKSREQGLFFTPPWLAERLADRALGSLTKDRYLTILDPACGSGRLLVACLKHLLPRQLTIDRVALTRRLIAKTIRGIDCDRLSVFLTRTNLWLLADPFQGPVEGLTQAVVTGDAIAGPVRSDDQTDVFRWEHAFAGELAAGGFTAIVSNPPFEVLTGFRTRPELRHYSERIRRSGYKLAFGGTLNTSRLFLERALEVLAVDGHLAFIMPYSFLMDRNAQNLRAHLLRLGWLETVEAYPESSQVFSRVGQAVILLKVHKSSKSKTSVAITVAAGDDRGNAPVRLTLAQLAALDPVALPIPIAAADSLEVAERMHALNTSRMDQVAEGRVGEVDQTFYRKHFRSTPGDGLALLVRGAHLSPFTVDLGTQDPHERWLDAGGFTEDRRAGRFIQDLRSARVVQTGIVNLEASRRLVAAIVPAGVYLGNSVNYWVAHPHAGIPENELVGYLVGLLNATAMEWRFRLTSSNHNINLYEVRALPLPLFSDGFSPSRSADFLDRSLKLIRSSHESVPDVVERIVGVAGAPLRDDQAIARLIGRVAWLRIAEKHEKRQEFLEALLDRLIVWHLGMHEADLARMLEAIPARRYLD
jgi:adenine-specific DNA-methyltransferase